MSSVSDELFSLLLDVQGGDTALRTGHIHVDNKTSTNPCASSRPRSKRQRTNRPSDAVFAFTYEDPDYQPFPPVY